MGSIETKSGNLSNQLYLFTDKYKTLIKFIVEIKGTPHFDFERIIPTCGPEMLINLNDCIVGKFHNQEAKVYHGDYVVAGNRIDYFDSLIPDNSHYIVIKFTNVGYNRLLKLPLQDISNSYIKNLQEKKLRPLIFRLAESKGLIDKVTIIKKWIDEEYVNSNKYMVGEYLESLIENKPDSSSNELEKLTGYTSKHLNKIFKSYSGYTISNYKRLCRFQNALNLIKKEKNPEWTDLLYTCNFYDQSHFIKELKSFTGLTPSMLKENLSKPNGYNLTF